MMRPNQLLVIYGLAVGLCIGTGTLLAQDNNGGGQGRQGRGNFDPAQFQQRMMDNIKERLAFTNETEWAAVQPLVQKVMDARRAASVGMSGFGRRGGTGGDNAGRHWFRQAQKRKLCKKPLIPMCRQSRSKPHWRNIALPTKTRKPNLQKLRRIYVKY